jgi:hypothetical protein
LKKQERRADRKKELGQGYLRKGNRGVRNRRKEKRERE